MSAVQDVSPWRGGTRSRPGACPDLPGCAETVYERAFPGNMMHPQGGSKHTLAV